MTEVVERCEEGCEFRWSSIPSTEISERIVTSSTDMSNLLLAGKNPEVRRSPGVWSPVEYASHVRDVLFNLRDRIVVALNEENPLCKGLFGTPRVELGLYDGDLSDIVGQELKMAAKLFARTWDRIPVELRSRTMVYGYPRLADRSLNWVAAQALHEVVHHLADVRNGLASP
jgi:hypothetical protein